MFYLSITLIFTVVREIVADVAVGLLPLEELYNRSCQHVQSCYQMLLGIITCIIRWS